MSRYIDADAAIEALMWLTDCTKDKDYADGATLLYQDSAIERIKDLPTADVAPVRHGRWVKESIVLTTFPPMLQWHCSECGRIMHWFTSEVLTNYCPHCGAKMDGGEDAGRNK